VVDTGTIGGAGLAAGLVPEVQPPVAGTAYLIGAGSISSLGVGGVNDGTTTGTTGARGGDTTVVGPEDQA
jgi:hypothetical protein